MLRGKSWITTIGGIICLAGGAFLLYKMIIGEEPIDTMHMVLLTFCFGGGTIGVGAKDRNVHSDPFTGKNVTVKKL